MHARKYKVVAVLLLALVTIIGIASATYYMFWTHKWEIPWLKPLGDEGVIFEIVKDFDEPGFMNEPNMANITFENVDVSDVDYLFRNFMYIIHVHLSITGPSDCFSPECVTVRWQTWQNGTWQDDFIVELVDEGETLSWGGNGFYAGCSEFDYYGYYLITITINDKADKGVYAIDLEFSGEAIFGC